MSCWIGIIDDAERRTVRLAGRLTVDEVPDLLRACAVDGSLQLDLTDLVAADPPGIEALQRVRGAGATLVGVPGYILLKLDSPAARPTPVPPARRI